MKKTLRKTALILGKTLLAVALMGWVLSKTHWNDYVQLCPEYGGQTWAYVKTDGQPKLQRGWLYWKQHREFVPTHCQLLTDSDEAAQTTSPDQTHQQYLRRGMAGTLRQLHWGYFTLAMAGFLISLLLTAWRLWYLLRVQGWRFSPMQVVRLTFLGHYYSQVLPGAVGGDAVKAWYISKQTHRTAAVLVTIFVDRLAGLFGMMIMAAVMLGVVFAIGMGDWATYQPAILTVSVAAGASIGLLALLLSSKLRRLFHVQKLYQKAAIAHHIQAAGESINVFRRRQSVLPVAGGITLISQCVLMAAIALLGEALKLQVPLYSYFIFLPLIYIIGSIPITPGGVGLMEKFYLTFFATVGASASAILVLAMLARLCPMVWAIPGLWFAITGTKLPPADEIQAELDQKEQQELDTLDNEPST